MFALIVFGVLVADATKSLSADMRAADIHEANLNIDKEFNHPPVQNLYPTATD